jgi:serine/threonine protein kinase/tetratricopeptide (TPR) repeat protein
MSQPLPDTLILRRPHHGSDSSAVERLAEDMIACWRKGERPLTEHYLEQFPHLQQSAEVVLELLAEELALREEYREPVSLSVFTRRFPQWPAQIQALIECQRTLGPRIASIPKPGDSLGEFQLVSELGRGSHARVFLATQPSLDSRLVVLKLGPAVGQEHLSLARLQHSHIVPLYSVHEFPDHGLRGLCLPYFGGSTLHNVLANLKQQNQPPTGNGVLAAIQQDRSAAGDSPPDCGTSEFLKTAAFPDIICWIGVCLADALQYAHERGLLHLDLKPSNILLASDGVPMLLDFHLARPPLHGGDSPPFRLGGTPGYMAPEHLEAVQAVRDGVVIPRVLDARADVYSLGVVLRDALAGAPESGGSFPSVGLADILARCTASDPDERYPTAAALAKDLGRHLANQSLTGVPNRSLAELWHKWRRRRPHALPLLMALISILAVFGGLAIHTDRLASQAAAALREGHLQLNQGRYTEASESFRSGELLVEGLPFHRELRTHLREEKLMAERGQTAVELHLACDQIRPLYAADFATPLQSQQVEKHCRDLWDKRDLLVEKLSGQMSPELERQWRSDLLDVAILAGRSLERTASGTAKQEIHREALLTLDQAENLLGASGILYLERVRHARALGQYAIAERSNVQAQDHPPQTAWDHVVLGRYYLSSGDVRRAIGEMNLCLQRDPQSLWGHYFKGVCCLRLGRAIEAVAEFSACTILAPNAAWCIHNLGQAYSEAGEPELALSSFDRALALEPGLSASYLGRATIFQRKGRYADALADLSSAAEGGISLAEVEYRKALVYLASGDRPASLASLRLCLKRDPRHVQAQETLSRVTSGR